ncbi:RsmB/NOP family class I SAM-dependent RNA methyltransferase [Albibacterium indicum]|uniref:RsmB/NOP family class I SAM-dependent RNA methyltransferase n=1 Tax=Albibacterium indicum TaxID=2292082 RepID=UPI000E4AFA51|nr:RsmB/NOP family class I SAM-dependent RNA methyltransferase [Pedobacter indicus]
MNVKRLRQQISTFKNILDQYSFDIPLSRFLSNYFRRNKQMGSKDRKIARRLVFNYFRLGVAFPDYELEAKLAIAEYLCTNSSDFVELLEPSLLSTIGKPIEQKLQHLKSSYDFTPSQCFPLPEMISDKINVDDFLVSHFDQRRLFIRMKLGSERYVMDLISENNIEFTRLGPLTLQLEADSQLDKIKEIAGHYEVQDLSSQRTIDFFRPEDGDSWWDACAASGGKALLLIEKNPTIRLLVSDIRVSILRNLDERFDKAGIRIPYRKKVIDLTKGAKASIGDEKFDGIIIDAPCSGSGTWGRSPEQMSSFTLEKLKYYSQLQRQILLGVIKHVKIGKPIIYMTCSVYQEENEDHVQFLSENGFQIETMDYLEGSDEGADTLFAARMIRII